MPVRLPGVTAVEVDMPDGAVTPVSPVLAVVPVHVRMSGEPVAKATWEYARVKTPVTAVNRHLLPLVPDQVGADSPPTARGQLERFQGTAVIALSTSGR